MGEVGDLTDGVREAGDLAGGTACVGEGAGGMRGVGDRYDALLLDNQLCFPLYAAAKEVTRRYGPLLKEFGLTYTQYIAMMALWERRSLTARDLGRRLYLDSGTLTPILKKLEARGLVTRERDGRDERRVVVRVTERGMALRDRALGVPAGIARCVDLSADEAVELRRILRKLLAGIERSYDDEGVAGRAMGPRRA